jgi:hypothetical protein
MKKLALALVCLVSIAFFASCTKEGQPVISVLEEAGYVKDGDVITLGEEFSFGFVMTSSVETNKELTKLVVKIDDEVWEEKALTGNEYTYTDKIAFEAKNVVANVVITATVTDAAGAEATATINLSLDEALLVAKDFSWNRHGGEAATGNLAELGLQWTSNAKEIYAVIKPVAGAQLYKFGAERDVWNNTNTESEKVALFNENLLPISEFKEVSCTAGNKDYDIVLGTIYNGKVNLIHVTHSAAFTFKGTDVTITGQYK